MAKLIAIASFGKGTWTQIIKLCNANDWEKIFIITDEFGMKKFPKKENIEFIEVNFNDNLQAIKNKIFEELKEKINDLDVGLNLFSGDGKTHMAVLSALLNLGLGIRLVYFEDDEMKELSPFE
ncbi:MAG: hypothetical protein PWQ87_840 [Candidatus Woesearchaeota archaeon]|nr:hypothetical protein [Candidatus Woesearchaeota archaeon]